MERWKEEGHLVEKHFKWEMAHRLIGQDPITGKIVPYGDNCRNLHGHSYQTTIKMRRTDVGDTQTTLDEYGMVYDYNKMKRMKKWIDDNLDHCVIISAYDKELINFIQSQEGRSKHFIISSPSTAENLCTLIFGIASRLLNDTDGKVLEVSVMETASSKATYRP